MKQSKAILGKQSQCIVYKTMLITTTYIEMVVVDSYQYGLDTFPYFVVAMTCTRNDQC